MRLIFMGTPEFAVPTLAALLAAGHEVAAVYSQPPRKAGRGAKLRPSPVHAWAEAQRLDVRTPTSLRKPKAQEDLAALGADAGVVAAYGLILPAAVLDAPRLGCFNVHASLLPRWRGAAPIQRAIMAGDAETGITIMAMDEGLDTGAMLLAERVPIGPATTAGDLHDKLAAIGGPLMVAALAGLADGSLTPTPQPAKGATYAAKIDKAEARLDWTRSASDLDRLVRGLSPFPGAWFEVAGERIKLLLAAPAEGEGEPGIVLDDAPTVACGDGALRLLRLQRAGKGALDADMFRRGFAWPVGERLA
ncbi:MAG: methionyl-tRNA formyltransferase [Alphaproteobacteria bacterium]